MADRRRAAFRAFLKARGLNVAEAARICGVPPSTLYSFLSGDTLSSMATTEARVAAGFNTTVDEIFGATQAPSVSVRGRIGVKAEVYTTRQTEELAYQIPLPADLDIAANYVAYEIEGISMPLARPGWVVIFKSEPADPADMVGYPVLAELADGQRLFKILRRGYEPGLWNLEAVDGADLIEGAKVVSCLPFASISAGRMAR